MAYSYITVTATNGQTNFAFNFPYLSRLHIAAYVDETPVTFTWLNSSTLTLDEAVAGTPEVTIRRHTPKGELQVNWQDGANQTERDMDAANLQMLYITQEITDASDDLSAGDASAAAIAARDQAVTAAEEAAESALAAAVSAEEAAEDVAELIATVLISETVGSNIVSASTINPTGADQLVTGTNRINAFDLPEGFSSCRLRFQSSLNITHSSALVSPHGYDYRTIPNEVLEFRHTGSGNCIFWSLNGPKEAPGDTLETYRPSAPAGFADEDGTAISRTDFSGLFQAIGTTHGVGNGSTTFNKPNSRGRVTINMDGGDGTISSASVNGANSNTMGGKGGAQTHTLSSGETPLRAHGHTGIRRIGAVGDEAESGVRIETINGASDHILVNDHDGFSGSAHSNTQPWIAKKRYIRL